jgi:hypothetical protein
MFKFPKTAALLGRAPAGAQVVVPNTKNLESAATVYFTAARNAGVNKANISAVNAAIKKLATNAYGAALAPAAQQAPAEALAAPAAPPGQGTANYGLSQAYKNLTNKMQRANKNGLSNLVAKAQVAINASKNNQGLEVSKLRANVNAQVKKANALNKATGGLEQAVKSFLTLTANAAKKNNANYVNRLNMAFNQLGNLKPVFQANYNKAKANASKTISAAAQAPSAVAKAIPPTKQVGRNTYFIAGTNMKEGNLLAGTSIYKNANNKNGYVQGKVKKGFRGLYGGNFNQKKKWNYYNNKGWVQRAVAGQGGTNVIGSSGF